MRSTPRAACALAALTLLASCGGGHASPPAALGGNTSAPATDGGAGARLELPPETDAIAPEVSVQTGHTMPVVELVLGGDGNLLLSESSDSLRLWDVRTGLVVRTVGRRSLLGALALDPHGKRFVGTARHGMELHLRDLATFEELGQLAVDEGMGFSALAFTGDGAHVVAGVDSTKAGTPAALRVLRAQDLSQERAIPLRGTLVSAVAVDPRGGWSAAGIEDGEVVVVDVASGQTRCKLAADRPGETASGLGALSMTSDPSGARLGVTYNDGVLTVFDVARCAPLGTKRGATEDSAGLLGPGVTPIYAYRILGFRGGDAIVLGKAIDVGMDNNELFRWTPGADPQPLGVAAEHVRAAAMGGPDGAELAVAPGAGGVELYDATTVRRQRAFAGQARQVLPLGFDADDRTMYLMRLGRGELESFLDAIDLGTGRLVHTCKLPGHVSSAGAVAVDPARGLFAAATESSPGYSAVQTVALYTLATCAKRVELSRGSADYSVLAFAEDGSLAAAGYRTKEESFLEIRDPGAVRPRVHLSHVKTEAFRIAMSARAHRLVVAASPFEGDRPTLFDTLSGAPIDVPMERPRGGAVVALSADGRTLATAARDGDPTATLWDTRDGHKVRELHGGSVPFGAAAFSPDGAELRAVDGHGAVRSFDVATGAARDGSAQDDEPILASFSPAGRWFVSVGMALSPHLERASDGAGTALTLAGGATDYALFAPSGEYLAPPAALTAVAFRVGTRAYPFEQFDLLLDRPHAVLSRLGANPDLVSRMVRLEGERAKQSGGAAARDGRFVVGALPLVRVDALPVSTADRALRVHVRAAARGALARVQAWVDDVPAAAAAAPAGAHDFETTLAVTLGAGDNHLDVSAFDADGLESLRESAVVTYTGEASKPDLYVVAVGVSHYANPTFDLTYAAKDARDVADYFAKSGKSRYGAVHATTVLDKDATRDAILAALGALKTARVDDVVVAFLAGHGMLDASSQYFFGTTDIDPTSPSDRGLSYRALEDAVAAMGARRKLVMMDTCYAGEVDPGAAALAPNVRATTRGFVLEPGSGPGAPATPGAQAPPRLTDDLVLLGETFGDLRRASGAVVIASSEGREFAFESPEWNNGVFTFAALGGLRDRRADADGDGVVRVSELREYVGARVSELTGGGQHPTARRENLVLDFPVSE